jgi:putative tryptophan/tyrosine transport system substrate-binding protein
LQAIEFAREVAQKGACHAIQTSGDLKKLTDDFVGEFGCKALPLTARAQPADRIARVGFFGADRSAPLPDTTYRAFIDELQIHGFKNGQNLIVDYRRVEQDLPALSADAAELVRSNVNVLVTQGTEPALQAALGATRTLPIVMMAANYDPFASGYVKSLARPDGNVTGVFLRQTELAEKQTELLWQAFPDRTHIRILWDAISAPQFNAAERRAKIFGLQVYSLKLENPPYDFEAAFGSLAAASTETLLVLSSPHFISARGQIVQLAIQHRMPTMFIFRTYVEAGGLLSYGADFAAMHRQAATHVAKILKGAKVGDIPIEQPNRFEFAVNLRTAKAIGIELPTSILLRADEVIE